MVISKAEIVWHAHVLDRGFQQGVLIPTLFADHGVALAIVFGVDHDAVLLFAIWEHLDLDFGVRVDSDVEDLTVTGKPGICPAAIIADADRGDAVDNR